MSSQDIRDLARLHVASLPDSLVGAFGEGYVRAFYRFVARSSREVLAVRRGSDGHVCAAGVVSLAPGTFERRLLGGTPLAWYAVCRLPALAARVWRAWREPRHPVPPAGCEPGLPELILTFADARLRGQGHGAALLRELEDRLAGQGVKAYQVRTVLDASNAALAFYRANGFAPVGVSRRLGTNFQVFVKSAFPA